MVSGVNGNNFEKQKSMPFEIDAERIKLNFKNNLEKNPKSPSPIDLYKLTCDR